MATKKPGHSGYAVAAPAEALQSKQDLVASERRFELLVQSVTDYAIYMLDPAGIVTNWNSGAQRFKGYAPAEIVGQHFSRFFTPEDRAGMPEQILETATREDRFEAEGVRVRKDGTHFWASVVVDAIRDDAGGLIGFAKITRDISERRRNEERLFRLAHFDSVTDLPNRVTLREGIEGALASGSPVTVLMLDLDGFKEVNDTLGHSAGDAVLKVAGDRIKRCASDQETVGRLGGDEFAIVLPGQGDPTVAADLACRLIDAFRTPFEWEQDTSHFGLSIGIAISLNHGESAEEILSNADLALHRAKADRRQLLPLPARPEAGSTWPQAA